MTKKAPDTFNSSPKIYGSDLRNRAVGIALGQHRPLQVAKQIEA